MGIQVLPAEDADMDRIFEIACIAFDRNEPLWDAMWPNHWLDTGRQKGAARMRAIRTSTPSTTYLKAVDEESGIIMGMAKWNIFDDLSYSTNLDNPPQPAGDHWENEDEASFAALMTKLFLDERNAAIRKNGGHLVSLDILTIDPAYQRRGVGDALVKWGTKVADDMRVEAVVESSVFGKGLYEKNGYVFVKDVVAKAPDAKWKDRAEGRFAWMVRPKKQ